MEIEKYPETQYWRYEELLNLNSKTLWNEDLKLSELEKYFDRSYESIRKAISKKHIYSFLVQLMIK